MDKQQMRMLLKKIIIKDLPISVSNTEVEEFLQGKEGLMLQSM